MEIVLDSVPFNILGIENPELFTNLTSFFSKDTVDELERQVALYNIDQVWSDYLDHVAYIQDGVKLSIIRAKNPLIEFQMATSDTYQKVQQEIKDRILQDFEALDLSENGLCSLQERIKPPSSTWTYLVNDKSLMESLSSGFIGGAISSVAMIFSYPVIFVISIYKRIYKSHIS
ncbi:hypothetical protein [Clostridium sp.]|uniref:hypothetical protein n=1 Tax=Clostridium sp. TaxID=1506 RepID=UPI003D6CE4C0